MVDQVTPPPSVLDQLIRVSSRLETVAGLLQTVVAGMAPADVEPAAWPAWGDRATPPEVDLGREPAAYRPPDEMPADRRCILIPLEVPTADPVDELCSDAHLRCLKRFFAGGVSMTDSVDLSAFLRDLVDRARALES